MSLPILLKNQKVLLIGGGKVALQKAKVLFENGISFRIIAKEIIEDIKKYSKDITIKEFEISDIKEFIIIDATGNDEVTKKLLEIKKTQNILLNVVDKPEFCDFYFMALINKGDLKVAVSSNGSSPSVAKFIRDEIKSILPNNLDTILKQKKQLRKQGIIDMDVSKLKSKIYLISAGPGDVELLTIKAYNTIKKCDVILYDHLISDEILDIVECEKIYVGKEKGKHSKSQEEINQIILDYAKKGLKVGRLKSGDAFIFGRGYEELEFLVNEGFNVEVIPGISSATAISSLNLPLTTRGVSSSFSIHSAHLKGNRLNLSWLEELKKENHTIVVLMGLSRTRHIAKKALENGINETYPVAIISNITRNNQKIIKTKIKNLIEDSKNAEKPAILVFGSVVGLLK